MLSDGCCHDVYVKLVNLFPFLDRRRNVETGPPPRLTLEVPSRNNGPQEKGVQRTFSSDDLQDTATHRLQSSASKFARSHSEEAINPLTEYRSDPLSPRARRNSFNSDTLLDSPRHRVQAAASGVIRRHSLSAIADRKRDGEMKEMSPRIPRLHNRFPVSPEACFEFGAFSDDEGEEEENTSSSKRRGRRNKNVFAAAANAVWQFFARPFISFSKGSGHLKVVRGRIRSSSRQQIRTNTYDTDSGAHLSEASDSPTGPEFIKDVRDASGEGFPSCPAPLSRNPTDFAHTHHLLDGCEAFDLKLNANMTSEEARNLRCRSISDPACLLGTQICLLGDYDTPSIDADEEDTSEAKMCDQSPETDSVDESVKPLSERVRVVVAFERKYNALHTKKLNLYLLVKKDGTFEWSELSRSAEKRGYRFTALRRVCV